MPKLGYICAVMQKNISVVISFEDSINFLEKVLLGYNTQTYRNFEIIIACNNVSDAVTQLTAQLKGELFYSVTVITGFVCEAVNVAATDYIILSSSCCVPRADFIEQHIKYREEGYYLTGSSLIAKSAHSLHITKDTLYTGAAFKSYSTVVNTGLWGGVLNRIAGAGTKWNMKNVSAWKKDIQGLANVSPESGAEMIRNGIKSRQIGFTAVCLDLTAAK